MMHSHIATLSVSAFHTLLLCAPITLAAQQRWTVEPRAVTTIGSETGAPEALFHRIEHTRRMPSGEILVVDGATNELRFFGSDGRFLRRVGGKGSGPAEFRNISGVVLENGTLRIFDRTLRKIAVFNSRGEFVSTHRVDATGSAVHSLSLYGLAGYVDGNPIFVAAMFPADMRPAPVRYWDSLPTLAYTPTGQLRDTIGEFAGMDTYSTPTQSGDVRYARASSATVSGNRLYMTDGGKFAVRVYSGSGALLTTIARDRPARPVTERDIAAMSADRLSRAGNDEAAKERARRDLATWPRAATKPWISRVLVDDLGNLWAEQYAPFWERSASVWHVFDARGSFITELTLPAGFRLYHAGSEFLTGVSLDADGVESVQVLRLTRG